MIYLDAERDLQRDRWLHEWWLSDLIYELPSIHMFNTPTIAQRFSSAFMHGIKRILTLVKKVALEIGKWNQVNAVERRCKSKWSHGVCIPFGEHGPFLS